MVFIKKILSFISNILKYAFTCLALFLQFMVIILFCLFISVGEFYGIYHSFKEHGLANNILVFIPPMAHIMAIESFFHKSETLEIKLKDDCNILASIIVIKTLYRDAPTLNKEVDEVIKSLNIKFKAYSDDKRKYLKEFGTDLINFYVCVYNKQFLYFKNKYILKNYQSLSNNNTILKGYYNDCKKIIAKYPYSKKLFELLNSTPSIKILELESEKFFKDNVAVSEDKNKIKTWEANINFQIRAFKIYSEFLLNSVFNE